MGIYDREYYQDDYGQRGFSFGGQRQQMMMVTKVVIVTAVIFVLDIFSGGNVSAFLGLDLVFYRRPWLVYQLLGYGFVHAGVWHIALNMFVLWMFGRFIEERLGRREFLFFYLASIVFAGLVWLICQHVWLLSSEQGRVLLEQVQPGGKWPSLVGASGGVVAVFLIFVLYYPKQTVYLWGILAMPAWVLGAFIIGINLIQGITGTAGVTAWEAHLGGAAFAFLYLRSGISFDRLFSRVAERRPSGWKFPRRGPKLRVHDPDGSDQRLAAEADRILDKVHREGEQSLTGRERRTLEKYSRRVRGRRG